ncbi:2-oxo-4-hydroxy-4-carboxy-5-ureidoimidazoline decarboxylase [Aminobacter sp. DSM 101952]|uniref:2-oxo-4-hydroxy-4-carboxy-5-ureidoimidazoline decarboxylase n=1 Tax=Aminobacter sp. DSM 101952 TaxID=2735891 RepID=UPI0009EA1439|nr:2-oxo-4-hydroxy-4-carboxy-5-ureidoimidazoline decarboxylase [Aminobacter sp. DSM 101952]
MDIDQVNRMSEDEFVQTFGGIFEHAAWVAQAAYVMRPFATVADMHHSMMSVVLGRDRNEQIGLLRGHPELAGKEALAGEMTPDSSSEQGRLELDRLSAPELADLTELNRKYWEKFGFPCMICLRLHTTRETVFAEHKRRLNNDPTVELANCLDQVGQITERRLRERVRESSKARRALSTHILDSGNPGGAVGLKVELQRFADGGLKTVASVTTDSVGRAELLDSSQIQVGQYQMVLQAGAYLARRGNPSTFLSEIPVLFEIDDPDRHYHIPVIIGRYAYSVYRGGIPAMASGPTTEDVR